MAVKRFWKNSKCLFGQSKDKAQNIDIPVEHSPFYNGFACDLILRKSCCNCRHAELSRAGDVTLADFWGEKRFDEQQKYGISMIMVNTNAGKKLLQAAESNLVIHLASIVDAAHKNPRLYFGKKAQQYNVLYRCFFKIIEWAPLFLLNFLYGEGYRRRILKKLPYKLLWRKKNRLFRETEKEQARRFEEIFTIRGADQ